MQLNYYFTQLFNDDLVTLEVLRDGQKQLHRAPLWVPQLLIPRALTQTHAPTHSQMLLNSDLPPVAVSNLVGGRPSYFVVGGLVFTALTREYLASEGEYKLEHMEPNALEKWAEELRVLAMMDLFQEGQ